MSTAALSQQQSESLGRILSGLNKECEANAVVVADIGGNILAQDTHLEERVIETVAALAGGSFSATRELAHVIGEPGFKAIFHRGRKSGILIQALRGDFLILVLFGENSIEGLVRLCLKKVTPQIETILDETEGQTAESAGATEAFEVQEG